MINNNTHYKSGQRIDEIFTEKEIQVALII